MKKTNQKLIIANLLWLLILKVYTGQEQGMDFLASALQHYLCAQSACQYQNCSPGMAVPKSGMCIFVSIA